MNIPSIIDSSVLIKLDPEGRPSTDPSDVIKFTQQLLMKAILTKTENATFIPEDTTELISLTRELNATALTSRKLNQEETMIGNRTALVEAFKEFTKMVEGHHPTNVPTVARDVYKDISPPEIDINPLELTQGEQPLNPDDYLR